MLGVHGIPTGNVAAVSLNVTVINPAGGGFVTVYPCGDLPLVSSLNYIARQTVPNAVITPVSAEGDICLYASAATDLFADINGWFLTDRGFGPLQPRRLLDTRSNEPQGAVVIAKQPVGGLGRVLRVRVTGVVGVPNSGVGAVSLNVTAVNPVGVGFVTVYPCGAVPVVSSLNFVRGAVVPNAVIAPVSDSGEVCFYSNVDTDLVADINGWVASTAALVAFEPIRLVDSRAGSPDGEIGVTKTKIGGLGYVLEIGYGQPVDVGAWSMNVTVVNPEGVGYLTVFPCTNEIPGVSSLNFNLNQVVANAVIAPLSADGDVCFFASARTDILIDLNGEFINAG